MQQGSAGWCPGRRAGGVQAEGRRVQQAAPGATGRRDGLRVVVVCSRRPDPDSRGPTVSPWLRSERPDADVVNPAVLPAAVAKQAFCGEGAIARRARPISQRRGRDGRGRSNRRAWAGFSEVPAGSTRRRRFGPRVVPAAQGRILSRATPGADRSKRSDARRERLQELARHRRDAPARRRPPSRCERYSTDIVCGSYVDRNGGGGARMAPLVFSPWWGRGPSARW